MTDKAISGTDSRNDDRQLPCPWCGEYPKVAEDGGITGPWFCVWHDCPPVEGGKARHYGDSLGCISIETAWFHTEAEAIEAWNTRAHGTLTAEQAIADELNAALGALEPHSNQLEPSRWHELFGTPERTARTIADLQTCSLGFDIECDECAVCSLCQSGARNDRDALLEWLKGGSDGE